MSNLGPGGHCQVCWSALCWRQPQQWSQLGGREASGTVSSLGGWRFCCGVCRPGARRARSSPGPPLLCPSAPFQEACSVLKAAPRLSAGPQLPTGTLMGQPAILTAGPSAVSPGSVPVPGRGYILREPLLDDGSPVPRTGLPAPWTCPAAKR